MKKRQTLFSTLVLMIPFLVWSAQTVYIQELLDAPQRFQNLEVKLTGKVVDVMTAQRADQRGGYRILDQSDATIYIIADTLPAPETTLTVTGIVQIDPATQKPVVRELKRSGGSGLTQGWDMTLVLLIAAIVVVAIIILIVALRPKKQPMVQMGGAAATQPPPPPRPASTQNPPAMQTRQVSQAELATQLGEIKTAQVPTKLAQLVIIGGDMNGKAFPLKLSTTIGRDSGDVVLKDSSVSKEHARILFEGNDYHIENLSQTNPVVLNSQRLGSERKVLNEGDEMILGLVKLTFKLI